MEDAVWRVELPDRAVTFEGADAEQMAKHYQRDEPSGVLVRVHDADRVLELERMERAEARARELEEDLDKMTRFAFWLWEHSSQVTREVARDFCEDVVEKMEDHHNRGGA